MSVPLLILGLILFSSLIVLHEFGHFIMARRNGVEVEEFAIFFPPRLYKRKTKAGWKFVINLLPVGGYVKMKGEHDSDTEPGSFGAASLLAKSKIMAAGVVMNLLSAFVLFTIVALMGTPQLVPNQFSVKSDSKVTHHAQPSALIDSVEAGAPAAKAGLKVNDRITALGPVGHVQTLTAAGDIQKLTKTYAGQTVQIGYTRNGQQHQTSAVLNTTAAVVASKNSAHPKHYLGVASEDAKNGITTKRSTWSAPIVAVGTAWQFTALTFQGLGHAIGGLGSIIAGFATHNHVANSNGQIQAGSQIGGPIAIFFVLKDGSSLGLSFTLFIIAYISLTLAIINILPIPALDGGRLWITLFTRAIKKPLTPKLEERINAGGFAFLLLVLITSVILDTKHFL